MALAWRKTKTLGVLVLMPARDAMSLDNKFSKTRANKTLASF